MTILSVFQNPVTYKLVACPMTLCAMYSARYDVAQMYYDGLVGNFLLEERHHDLAL